MLVLLLTLRLAGMRRIVNSNGNPFAGLSEAFLEDLDDFEAGPLLALLGGRAEMRDGRYVRMVDEREVVRELFREDVQGAEGQRIEPAVGIVAVCLDPVHGPENSALPLLIAAIDIAVRPAIYYRQKIRLPSS